MKFINFILLAMLSISSAIAQFGPQQIIPGVTTNTALSIPLDIDNDGYIDILGTGGSKLQWHRNLDGQGNFGPEIIISNNTAIYLSIEFVDLDSDGDKDILFLRNNPRNAIWHENIDGLGNFGPQQIILENMQDYIESIKIEDVDEDGDLDIIANRVDTFSNRIVWYENLSGLADFSEENLLVEGGIFSYIYLPLFVDIDNDGLQDLLSSDNGGPAKLIWYKNLGNVVFSEKIEIHQFFSPQSDWTRIYDIKYLDINSDDKKDIVVTSHNADVGTFYHWFENIDNLGTFSDVQPLPISGVFSDIDNDGDNDILVGNRFVNRLYWVENIDGLGTFSNEHTISTEIDFLRHLGVSDLNGDGLVDVVSASSGDNKIAWYENTGILGVSENNEANFTVYPNPTNSEVYINSKIDIATIAIFDNLGRNIKSLQNTKKINLVELQSGIYFIKITSAVGASETIQVVKM